MDYRTKKTIELTPEEKLGLVNLFNIVFDRKRTVEEFDRQYCNNPQGFSYHTFAVADGKIVASTSMIPSIYRVKDKMLKFVNSVDTMIDEPYRDFGNFCEMMKVCLKDSKNVGYDAVYSFPNDNSYLLFTKLKFMADVGKLDTYCLPYRIGGVKKGLRWLNCASMLFCHIWVRSASLFASSKKSSFIIEKDSVSYNATRYKRGDGLYSVIDGLFAYKVMEYEGVRTAFVIDVFEKSAKNFVKSVKYLIKNEKKNFDLILYVGHLTFGSYGLVKFPRKYEPKHFNFTGAIFNNVAIDKKDFFAIDNWDINLSNYDVI